MMADESPGLYHDRRCDHYYCLSRWWCQIRLGVAFAAVAAVLVVLFALSFSMEEGRTLMFQTFPGKRRRKHNVVPSTIQITSHTAATTAAVQPTTRCSVLQKRHGFWNERQCHLWNLVENGTSLDMSPYLADNIPPKSRWWPQTWEEPPGSGKGKLVYNLHLHKCGGTTVCRYFREAKPIVNTSLIQQQRPIRQQTKQTVSSDNCNIPRRYWYNESLPGLDYGWAAYIGDTREKMKSIYQRVRKKGWIFVASEGSLEDEPIFGDGPYFHMTILREPHDWLLSNWHYHNAIRHKTTSLDDFFQTVVPKETNAFVRRLCGSRHVHDTLTEWHFLKAKSMLEQFDMVLILEELDRWGTSLLFRHHFPSLNLPLNQKANVGSYDHRNPPNLTTTQLEFIQNYTELDKVLYEYSKLLYRNQLKKLEES